MLSDIWAKTQQARTYIKSTGSNVLREGLLTMYQPVIFANKRWISSILKIIQKKFCVKTRPASAELAEREVLTEGKLPPVYEYDKEERKYTFPDTVKWEEIYSYLMKTRKRNAKRGVVYTMEQIETFREEIVEKLFDGNVKECFDYSKNLLAF